MRSRDKGLAGKRNMHPQCLSEEVSFEGNFLIPTMEEYPFLKQEVPSFDR